MIRSLTVSIIIAIVFLPAPAQESSVHQREWQMYRDHPELVGKDVVPSPKQQPAPASKREALKGIIYGFHPYWMNGAESNYDFSLLTHLAYFSGDVDPATGGFSSTNSWSSASVVTKAKQNGVKVHFTITQFSGHTTLFNSYANKQALIKNIVTQIQLRNADGCNVDVEGTSGFSTALADSFRMFIRALGDTLHHYGKELCVELPAVDWSSGWFVYGPSFFSVVGNSVDQYFLMAYDYWWSGSSSAGPVAPLQASSVTNEWHALRSINTFLAKGCPKEKLIAGFPYYGLDWPTTSSATFATASGSANSRTYTVVKNNYIDTIPKSRQFWSTTYSTPFYKYVSGGTWRQTWYDDSASLSRKYDSVAALNIAGTGMWALGYDGSEKELWNALRRTFVTAVKGTDRSVPASFQLQAFPNPFNPSTTVRFSVAQTGPATVLLYDALGREAMQIFRGTAAAGEIYQRSVAAQHLASGLYIVRIESGGVSRSIKLMMVK